MSSRPNPSTVANLQEISEVRKIYYSAFDLPICNYNVKIKRKVVYRKSSSPAYYTADKEYHIQTTMLFKLSEKDGKEEYNDDGQKSSSKSYVYRSTKEEHYDDSLILKLHHFSLLKLLSKRQCFSNGAFLDGKILESSR